MRRLLTALSALGIIAGVALLGMGMVWVIDAAIDPNMAVWNWRVLATTMLPGAVLFLACSECLRQLEKKPSAEPSSDSSSSSRT